MVTWIRQSVSRQTGIIVAVSVALATGVVWWLGRLALIPELPARKFLVGAFAVVPVSGLFATWMTQRLLGSRLAHLVEVIDNTDQHDDLARIRNLGPDEVGAIGQAVNRLLARITSMRASMIDQGRELGKAHRELELSQDLAHKTEELAQRLEERTMLFDIMRMTTSSQKLDAVLEDLVERVGRLLRMREVVFFVFHENSQEFEVRASSGFQSGAHVHGRKLKMGEGISGQVGHTREPLVVEDVSRVPEYHGFWGMVERTGALAAMPVKYRDQLLGVLAVTRPLQDPITEVHLRLLSAVADTSALAIQNAQMFEQVKALTTQDELTGLPNDALLREQLEHEIDRARRFEAPFAVVAIGIDHLAAFNEEHGRDEGDKVLQAISQMIASSVRKVDTVARSEDDRLVLLLPRTDGRDAMFLAEKLRKATSALDLLPLRKHKLGISLGIAQLMPTDDRYGKAVLERAEKALVAAKEAGRDRVHVA